MKFTKMEKRELLRHGKINRSHISAWERGVSTISLKYLPVVAEVKGVTVGALVTILLEEQQERGKVSA